MNKLKTKARVRWFDRFTGEGFVRLSIYDHEYTLPIYACNIKGKKTWYPHTACVYYEKNQSVDVEVKWDKYVTFVIGLTPGHFDSKAWNALGKNKLAFKCDDDGKAITGLFE